MERRPAVTAEPGTLDRASRERLVKRTMTPDTITEHKGVVYRGKTAVGKSKTLADYERRAKELSRKRGKA
jgi:hypothetical protein